MQASAQRSQLPTPSSSFSAADRDKPLDIARLLDPFEQLEREFGWESTGAIRPPSAFCSLADIEEGGESEGDRVRDSEAGQDKVRDISEVVVQPGHDDSGVCFEEETTEEQGSR